MHDCPRCQGFVVNDALGVDRETWDLNVDMIRCVNCGWHWCPMMEEHRNMQPPFWPVTKSGRRRAPRTTTRRPDEDEFTEGDIV